MSDVIPIRSGLTYSSEGVSGLIDYAAECIRTFAEHDEPVSIGLAIIGRKKSIPLGCTLDESDSLNKVMALAGALLFNRAAQPSSDT